MQKYFPFAVHVKMSSHARELTCNAERSDAKKQLQNQLLHRSMENTKRSTLGLHNGLKELS